MAWIKHWKFLDIYRFQFQSAFFQSHPQHMAAIQPLQLLPKPFSNAAWRPRFGPEQDLGNLRLGLCRRRRPFGGGCWTDVLLGSAVQVVCGEAGGFKWVVFSQHFLSAPHSMGCWWIMHMTIYTTEFRYFINYSTWPLILDGWSFVGQIVAINGCLASQFKDIKPASTRNEIAPETKKWRNHWNPKHPPKKSMASVSFLKISHLLWQVSTVMGWLICAKACGVTRHWNRWASGGEGLRWCFSWSNDSLKEVSSSCLLFISFLKETLLGKTSQTEHIFGKVSNYQLGACLKRKHFFMAFVFQSFALNNYPLTLFVVWVVLFLLPAPPKSHFGHDGKVVWCFLGKYPGWLGLEGLKLWGGWTILLEVSLISKWFETTIVGLTYHPKSQRIQTKTSTQNSERERVWKVGRLMPGARDLLPGAIIWDRRRREKRHPDHPRRT